MKKNDLIKTEDGIYRILSIEANRVLAIDCISKTMPKFYPVSSFGNGEFIDCMPADFPDMEDLSPADRKIAQERYTMIASAVSVVDDTQQRNLMIEKSSKQFGMSKQSIRSFLCSYLVYHSRSGYARYVFTVADIYNNQTLVHPDVDFVNRYTPDAMQWITKYEPWETIAEQHTMYPAYIRFLPKLRRVDAVNGILSCEGNWKNLMCMPKLGYTRYLRYCPECAKEDREKYGETYWHREHQIPKIRVCPKHRCFLENSKIEISARTSPSLHDAENNVPEDAEPKMCDSNREVEFTQYVIDVMHEPIDLCKQ